MRGILRPWFVGLLAIGLWGDVTTAVSRAQAPPFLVGKEEVWKYSAGGSHLPEGWKQASFDDAAWKSGRAGFGYGDSDDVTVLEDMRGRYTAVYIRKSFDLGRLDGIDSLYLYVKYDDGFIAYLNGKQVASASVMSDADGIRVEQHEAEVYEEFVIRDAKSLLRPGRNVLAIEGHNVSPDSSDFSLDPILATRKLNVFTVADYLADIDELERRLLDQSSYLTRLGFNYQRALTDLRRSVNGETQLARFVADVQKLVMQIGDCHASVQSGVELPRSGFLPLRPADTADGVAALRINRNQLLDPGCPYLESIDDVPLDRWFEAAARYVPRGSPQFIHRRSLEWLGEVGLLREELKLGASETVTVGLRSKDGDKHVTRLLRLTHQGYWVAQVRSRPTRLLDGNIGYLLIPTMDDRLIEPTVAKIRSFRDTKGLIIDVRNNDGGTYGLMRGIYGFFVPDDARPHVTNIAAYRLSANFARDHIEYRPTYRADWQGWGDQERAAIRQALAAFKPEWLPPEGKFSDWHYMILSRERSGRGDPSRPIPAGGPGKDYFFYGKPVVVLSNAGSFSAADGFLNAFADLPQVTIVGEPSGGGSGATRQFQLPKTRLVIALSSMASFRPKGKLFDGHGIEVDVAVKPAVEDYTTDADSVLARAIDVINEKAGSWK
jgi:Peptidase family S41